MKYIALEGREEDDVALFQRDIHILNLAILLYRNSGVRIKVQHELGQYRCELSFSENSDIESDIVLFSISAR